MYKKFKIRTCIECANYVPRHSKVIGNKSDPKWPYILVPDVKEYEHTCKINPEVMENWWGNYAHLTRDEMTPDMQLPCYELPKHLRLLDNCIKIAEDILERIEEKEKNESK